MRIPWPLAGVTYSNQCPVVGASRRCTCAVSPSSRLCFLALTNPRSFGSFCRPCRGWIIVYCCTACWPGGWLLVGNFWEQQTPVLPSTPRSGSYWLGTRRSKACPEASLPCCRCVPSMYVCCQSIQSFVLLAITNPRSFCSVCRPCCG